MDIEEAFTIVLELAEANQLDPELYSDQQKEVERQGEAFKTVYDWLSEHGIYTA